MKKRRYLGTKQFYRLLLWDCKTVEPLEERKDELKTLGKPEQPTAQPTPTH